MNTKTNKRLVKGAIALAAIALVVVLGRFGGEIATSIPPEVLISLAAIAGLLGHALLELRDGAPRGLNRGFNRRFQGDFVKAKSKLVTMWQREDNRAAA